MQELLIKIQKWKILNIFYETWPDCFKFFVDLLRTWEIITWSRTWTGFNNKMILQKICINSTPLVIIFDYLFGSSRPNFGPLCWGRTSLVYLILIILLDLVCSKDHWQPRNEVISQNQLSTKPNQYGSNRESFDLKLKC